MPHNVNLDLNEMRNWRREKKQRRNFDKNRDLCLHETPLRASTLEWRPTDQHWARICHKQKGMETGLVIIREGVCHHSHRRAR